ncbi:hypothetical protein HK101_005270, partial [Irineochytrium annulatum]
RVEGGINYLALYGRGLAYGSLKEIPGLPALGTLKDGEALRVVGERGEQQITEALHPLLKGVFQLDMTLMLEALSTLYMGKEVGELAKEGGAAMPASGRLKRWLNGLSEVHIHLLPASRALFALQKKVGKGENGKGLSLAQAMVLVKDQIKLSAMTSGTIANLNALNLNATNTLSGRSGSALLHGESRILVGPEEGVMFMDWISKAAG